MFFAPLQSANNPTQQAWGQTDVTVSARLVSGEFNIIQLPFQNYDPSGIMPNPNTVDALNSPQFSITNPNFKTINMMARLSIDPFQLPIVNQTLYVGIFLITSTAPSGMWLPFATMPIPAITVLPDNPYVETSTFAIPEDPVFGISDLPKLTFGMCLDLGSLDTIAITAIVSVWADETAT